MKLGMLTACLPGSSLRDIARYASSAGYQALEIAAWPSTGGRDFEAAHLDLEHFGREQAEEISTYMSEAGLDISALAYY